MNLKSSTFLFEKGMQWEEIGEGVSRQIMAYDEQLMVVKVLFEAGGIGSPHQHIHSQSTFVVSGIFEFTVEKETYRIYPGDCVYIHPNALHGCRCIEKGVLLDTFSPARKDFLEIKK